MSYKLAAVHFTPANEHDSQQIPHLVNDATVIAVGDGTYNASVMRRKMWREHKAYILAPPHPKQRKRIIQAWQLLLLQKRTKVECTFDYLKEHLLLDSSFPRSVQGYAPALHQYITCIPANVGVLRLRLRRVDKYWG